MLQVFAAHEKGGGIRYADLGAALRDLGQNYPPAEINKMAQQIGQGGMIRFDSFCQLMASRVTSKPPSAEDVIASFKLFDKDGTGFIQVKTLTEAMTRYGDKFNREEMQSMVEDAQPDPNGWVNYEELARMICSA